MRESHGDINSPTLLNHMHCAACEGHKVAMAGDGINDAPALAASSVSVVANSLRLKRSWKGKNDGSLF